MFNHRTDAATGRLRGERPGRSAFTSATMGTRPLSKRTICTSDASPPVAWPAVNCLPVAPSDGTVAIGDTAAAEDERGAIHFNPSGGRTFKVTASNTPCNEDNEHDQVKEEPNSDDHCGNWNPHSDSVHLSRSFALTAITATVTHSRMAG